MQVRVDVTDDEGVRVTTTYGPVLLSVVFDIEDEEHVIEVIRAGFDDARKLRAEKGNGHVQPV
jgi:hypothetical protein